ncbi:MAG: phosphoethanolamine transferase [Paludibacteraceae bacterium]
MKKSEKIVFVCLLVFLLLPNIIGVFLAQDLQTMGQRAIYMLTSISIYGLGLCIWRRRTFFYVASAGLLFSAIELVHLIINQATTSLLFVFTIIKSEKGEFMELLSTYWPLVIVFLALWGVYFYLNHRFIAKEYLGETTPRPFLQREGGDSVPTKSYSAKKGRIARYVMAGVFGLYLTACVVGLKLRPKFQNEFTFRGDDIRTAAWVGAEKVCPINFVLIAYHLSDMALEIRRQNEALRYFTFGVEAPTALQATPRPSETHPNPPYEGREEHRGSSKACALTAESTPLRIACGDPAGGTPASTAGSATAPVVVLVLGETSRYDHWQVNGYERETSPRLAKRELVSFDSCFSVANLTTVSVPFMLSRATPTNQGLYFQEKSVVDAFHEAGYETSWIADQSFNNHFLLRIAECCDHTFYFAPRRGEQLLDTVLLPPVRTVLNDRGGLSSPKPQMMVVHSLGCHFKYSQRYPDEFQQFVPDMKGMHIRALMPDFDSISEGIRLNNRRNSPALVRNVRDVLVNSYDNAILYTDYFLDSLIQILEDSGRPAVMVYVGDHGENLMDDEKHMLLHGTYAGSVYEYHVPLFVWMSEEYQTMYPDKMETLRGNTNKKMTTMYLFHSLLHLGGIRYRHIDLDKCIDSPAMEAQDTVYTIDANMNAVVLEL